MGNCFISKPSPDKTTEDKYKDNSKEKQNDNDIQVKVD